MKKLYAVPFHAIYYTEWQNIEEITDTLRDDHGLYFDDGGVVEVSDIDHLPVNWDDNMYPMVAYATESDHTISEILSSEDKLKERIKSLEAEIKEIKKHLKK